MPAPGAGAARMPVPPISAAKPSIPKRLSRTSRHIFNEVYPVPVLGMPKPAESRKDMISEVITDEVIWDCTTCRACQQACPVYIEHVDKIIDMRRNLAMERSQFPEAAQEALKSLGTRGHPYRGTTATRTTWCEGLEIKKLSEDSNVDMLYWVGCSAALDDRNMKVARAMAKILKAAGINFGILGDEESLLRRPGPPHG